MDIDELQVKISIEPENFKLLCLLGRLYEDKGMYSEAINVFTKAIIINDRDSNTFCSLGKCYFKVKEIEKGVHAFLKAVELDSDNFYALQNLANYYLKEKNYDLAKPICEKLLSIDKLSDFFDLIKLAKRNNDMQFLKKLYPIYFHKQPKNLTVARYYINYLMEENFYDEAEKLILDYSNRFVLDEKNTKKFNNMLITVYLSKNEYNNAKNKIIQLINENRPVSSVLLTNYAIATKDSDLAVSYITQFLSKNPYQVENWEQLMNIYHACGEEEKEKEAQRRVEAICEYHIKEKMKEKISSENKRYINIYIRCLEKNGQYELAEKYSQMLLSSKKRYNEYKENGQQYIPVTDDTIVSEEAQLISIDNDDYYDGSSSNTHIEGSKKQITINTFERNNYARKMCIAYHKPKCYICSFDFEKVYGIEFKGKIHVHHIKALYEIDDEYEVNPINDLIPVCPNCHYVLHSKRPPYKPYELINIIRENKKS